MQRQLLCPLNHHRFGSPFYFNRGQVKEKSYCGYKNYETWNVALFIMSNIEVYEEARAVADYPTFVKWMAWAGVNQTEDGIDFDSDKLDIKHLNEVIEEL